MVVRIDTADVLYLGMIAGRPPQGPLLHTPVLVKGRMFDHGAAEAVIDEQAAERLGVRPGDDLSMRMLSQSDFDNFDTGFGDPHGGGHAAVTA